MNSKHSFLNALGVTSIRWLCINMDNFVLSFHHTRTGFYPGNEIGFSQIISVKADLRRSYAREYYIEVYTMEKHYSFIFKDLDDFIVVVEALKHILRNNEPLCVPKPEYEKLLTFRKNVIISPLGPSQYIGSEEALQTTTTVQAPRRLGDYTTVTTTTTASKIKL